LQNKGLESRLIHEASKSGSYIDSCGLYVWSSGRRYLRNNGVERLDLQASVALHVDRVFHVIRSRNLW
jgi:hypothetical protein